MSADDDDKRLAYGVAFGARDALLENLRRAAGVTAPTVVQVDDVTRVEKRCQASGAVYHVEVATARYEHWRAGGKIQDCMPMLSDEQREFLMTGLTPAEWSKFFPSDDGGDS